MRRFEIGDQVRIDIPDKSDPDYNFHGSQGVVVEIFEDDAGMESGDERESIIYRVEFSSGVEKDFRWRDLRPPFDE